MTRQEEVYEQLIRDLQPISRKLIPEVNTELDGILWASAAKIAAQGTCAETTIVLDE